VGGRPGGGAARGAPAATGGRAATGRAGGGSGGMGGMGPRAGERAAAGGRGKRVWADAGARARPTGESEGGRARAQPHQTHTRTHRQRNPGVYMMSHRLGVGAGATTGGRTCACWRGPPKRPSYSMRTRSNTPTQHNTIAPITIHTTHHIITTADIQATTQTHTQTHTDTNITHTDTDRPTQIHTRRRQTKCDRQ
jgi:hypothetical protein